MIYTQENFYNKLMEEKKEVTIFLLNGVRVPGKIIAVDKFSVLILSNGKQLFLYKKAISTVSLQKI
ncbi:RNA chaperone Hfq (plasmid) [Bacillus cereus]|uniref:RNA-binding protein Hfq n=1 Tax=Bacillus cereus TaxID=1396 RepID=A0AB73USW6_BACCE|nr:MULTISPECIES: RNA chaperone Hfq [Bacillus]KIQ78885.1 Host factor-I protein [Bacillus sp. L_1B0_5]KIQ83018.1 Host factor-I protein [Bacillus sp. L_1B0_8]PFO08101.1 RNA chaperone Hfq [Bacillus thuringiensis]QHV08136.1 RNA chaperone Hfq [Bacillus cereus]QHV47640.1 RNA chaperone Hfq [Bacillus cereus]